MTYGWYAGFLPSGGVTLPVGGDLGLDVMDRWLWGGVWERLWGQSGERGWAEIPGWPLFPTSLRLAPGPQSHVSTFPHPRCASGTMPAD